MASEKEWRDFARYEREMKYYDSLSGLEWLRAFNQLRQSLKAIIDEKEEFVNGLNGFLVSMGGCGCHTHHAPQRYLAVDIPSVIEWLANKYPQPSSFVIQEFVEGMPGESRHFNCINYINGKMSQLLKIEDFIDGKNPGWPPRWKLQQPV